tara:strand:+ start:199 stop:519 length:321 start_codon:yes stop_codon:yes gene_type:complete
MVDKKNELPPPPPIFDKDKLLLDINNKLAEELTGSKSVKLADLKNPRRTWISYEYHLDIMYTIGNEPKQLTLLPNNFYDNNRYELTFEQQLVERLLRKQKDLNKGE